uniref:Uncharacterized protein n=1 Tax=Ixodes scapularis TaxID=6945 RepID=A0A4D5RBC7_IXOSC
MVEKRMCEHICVLVSLLWKWWGCHRVYPCPRSYFRHSEGKLMHGFMFDVPPELFVILDIVSNLVLFLAHLLLFFLCRLVLYTGTAE